MTNVRIKSRNKNINNRKHLSKKRPVRHVQRGGRTQTNIGNRNNSSKHTLKRKIGGAEALAPAAESVKALAAESVKALAAESGEALAPAPAAESVTGEGQAPAPAAESGEGSLGPLQQKQAYNMFLRIINTLDFPNIKCVVEKEKEPGVIKKYLLKFFKFNNKCDDDSELTAKNISDRDFKQLSMPYGFLLEIGDIGTINDEPSFNVNDDAVAAAIIQNLNLNILDPIVEDLNFNSLKIGDYGFIYPINCCNFYEKLKKQKYLGGTSPPETIENILVKLSEGDEIYNATIQETLITSIKNTIIPNGEDGKGEGGVFTEFLKKTPLNFPPGTKLEWCATLEVPPPPPIQKETTLMQIPKRQPDNLLQYDFITIPVIPGLFKTDKDSLGPEIEAIEKSINKCLIDNTAAGYAKSTFLLNNDLEKTAKCVYDPITNNIYCIFYSITTQFYSKSSSITVENFKDASGDVHILTTYFFDNKGDTFSNYYDMVLDKLKNVEKAGIFDENANTFKIHDKNGEILQLTNGQLLDTYASIKAEQSKIVFAVNGSEVVAQNRLVTMVGDLIDEIVNSSMNKKIKLKSFTYIQVIIRILTLLNKISTVTYPDGTTDKAVIKDHDAEYRMVKDEGFISTIDMMKFKKFSEMEKSQKHTKFIIELMFFYRRLNKLAASDGKITMQQLISNYKEQKIGDVTVDADKNVTLTDGTTFVLKVNDKIQLGNTEYTVKTIMGDKLTTKEDIDISFNNGIAYKIEDDFLLNNTKNYREILIGCDDIISLININIKESRLGNSTDIENLKKIDDGHDDNVNRCFQTIIFGKIEPSDTEKIEVFIKCTDDKLKILENDLKVQKFLSNLSDSNNYLSTPAQDKMFVLLKEGNNAISLPLKVGFHKGFLCINPGLPEDEGERATIKNLKEYSLALGKSVDIFLKIILEGFSLIRVDGGVDVKKK